LRCTRCGGSTPLGFSFCQQCGFQLSSLAPTDPSAASGAGAATPRIRPPSQSPPAGNPLAAPVDPQGATLAADGVRGAAGLPTARASPTTSASPPAPAAAAAPAARPAAWGTAVLVNRDGTDGQRFPLTSEDTIIGRAGADIAFEDDRFRARQHARIER